jgi:hypothetical protein
MARTTFSVLFAGFGVALLVLAPGCGGSGTPPAKPPKKALSGPAGAGPSPSAPQASQAPSGELSGAVVETMDSGGYTYVLVETPSGRVWAATRVFDVAVGDRVAFLPNMPMRGFRSTTLDRTFDLIYFAGSIRKLGTGAGEERAALPAGHPPIGGTEAASEITGIAKAEGGQTVEEIFQNKDELAGTEVLVRGKVVKYNASILGRNWLHIQDGSGGKGANDLTVTTSGPAKVGDTVLIRGTLSLERDFGAGYAYDVIVENATVTVE